MALENGSNNPELDEAMEGTNRELQELRTIVIANEGKDKLSIREDHGKIKIDKRTISFEGLFLQDGNGNEKKISKIDNFYVKRTRAGLEIYSNGEQLPRFKLNNNGTVEGRSNPNNNKFDIQLNGNGTIFESLKVELTNNYDKYKTPERKMDFAGKGFSIEQGGRKFSVNGGNIYFSGLKLYNSQSKKRETIQTITNMYVKRDSENNLTIYSSGEENPKMVLKPNGIVKGILPSNGDNLNYGAKEDTALRRVIWGELNGKYNTYRHEDVVSTSEPVLITYTTRDAQYVSDPIYSDGTGNTAVRFGAKEGDPKYVSEPIVADGRGNTSVRFDRGAGNSRYVSEPVVADGRGNGNNTPRETTSRESIPDNIEWKSVVPTKTYDDVPMIDEDLVREYGLNGSFQTKKTIHINQIGKVGKEIYINKKFKVRPKYVNGHISYYTMGQNIGGKYYELDSSQISGGGYWGTIYEDLNKKYFS